jgi:hypothetical protein
MPDWRSLLTKLVAARESELFPLLVFRLAPPAGGQWPAGLPCCPALRDFYAGCDGGILDQFDWHAQADLERETDRWREMLHDYHGDGQDILASGKHVLFATDSAGAPVIWDATDNSVASFYSKGGGWEPFGRDFEGFLADLFDAARFQRPGDLWAQALAQLPE